MKTVMTKTAHTDLKNALADRFIALQDAMAPRALMNHSEGAGTRKHWVKPENMVAYTGNETEIRLAVADFQAILKEITR